jgi:hypothetical protein
MGAHQIWVLVLVCESLEEGKGILQFQHHPEESRTLLIRFLIDQHLRVVDVGIGLFNIVYHLINVGGYPSAVIF